MSFADLIAYAKEAVALGEALFPILANILSLLG